MFQAPKKYKQGEKRHVVEQRADGPDEQHETPDVADVPLPGLLQVLLVDVVGGDRGLRKIVEQVVEQNLDRSHRQERQKGAGAEHAEHVAEVRARAHLDVLDDVAEHPAAFDDPLLQDQQVLLQQNDVRGFLGDVHRRVHGYADVRGLQRRAVVDAVAEEADDVPFQMQRFDHARLLLRRQFRTRSSSPR